MRSVAFFALILALGIGFTAAEFLSRHNEAAAAHKAGPDAKAIERTRAQVQMLDDLYKNFVVSITATYVGAEENVPAAKVAMKVFQAMHNKGWHKARLVDASGQPVRKANLPKTTFEKTAVAQLKKGKTYYEEIAKENGQDVLRAATIVPVVMKQCITCHQGKKVGDLLGAIVYEVPIK
jgi:predicted phage tail protein